MMFASSRPNGRVTKPRRTAFVAAGAGLFLVASLLAAGLTGCHRTPPETTRSPQASLAAPGRAPGVRPGVRISGADVSGPVRGDAHRVPGLLLRARPPLGLHPRAAGRLAGGPRHARGPPPLPGGAGALFPLPQHSGGEGERRD